MECRWCKSKNTKEIIDWIDESFDIYICKDCGKETYTNKDGKSVPWIEIVGVS